MSLARWARIRGDSEAAETALGALAFDDRFWLEEERGWQDIRLPAENTKQHTTWTWCNGRSGALLARQAVAEALQLSNPSPLVSAALHADMADALSGFAPGLCCGTPGVVDSLLQIDNHESGNQLSALSRGIELLTSDFPSSHYSTLAPSLFQGTAGLGFALLRAAHPKKIKSILAFE
jgi:lantibiotic modifying enzyme